MQYYQRGVIDFCKTNHLKGLEGWGMRKKQWWDHFINIISYMIVKQLVLGELQSIKPHTGSWNFSFDIISRKWVHLSLWGKYLDNNTQTVLLTPSKMRQARLNVSRFLGSKISWPSTYFICLSHCSKKMKRGRKTFLQNTKVYEYVSITCLILLRESCYCGETYTGLYFENIIEIWCQFQIF